MTRDRTLFHKFFLCRCVPVCVLAVTAIAGCGAGPVWTREDPRDVLVGFLTTAEAQDSDLMWEYLSERTREVLDARARDFNAVSQNSAKRKGSDMLRTTGHVVSSTREYKKLETMSENDREAVIGIHMHDGTKIRVTLRRESDRWTIDLPLEVEKP